MPDKIKFNKDSSWWYKWETAAELRVVEKQGSRELCKCAAARRSADVRAKAWAVA